MATTNDEELKDVIEEIKDTGFSLPWLDDLLPGEQMYGKKGKKEEKDD